MTNDYLANLFAEKDQLLENGNIFSSEAFMSERCEDALSNLKPQIRNATLKESEDFIPLIPLFQKDISRKVRAFQRRPTISEVVSPTFQTTIEKIADLGLHVFIDRPGLTKQTILGFFDSGFPANIEIRVLVTKFFLKNDLDYFPEIPDVDWVLYVLVPTKEKPRLNIFAELYVLRHIFILFLFSAFFICSLFLVYMNFR